MGCGTHDSAWGPRSPEGEERARCPRAGIVSAANGGICRQERFLLGDTALLVDTVRAPGGAGPRSPDPWAQAAPRAPRASHEPRPSGCKPPSCRPELGGLHNQAPPVKNNTKAPPAAAPDQGCRAVRPESLPRTQKTQTSEGRACWCAHSLRVPDPEALGPPVPSPHFSATTTLAKDKNTAPRC